MNESGQARPDQAVPSGEQSHGEPPVVDDAPEVTGDDDGAASAAKDEKTRRRPGDGYQPV